MRRKNGPSDLQVCLLALVPEALPLGLSSTTGAHPGYLSSQSVLSFFVLLKNHLLLDVPGCSAVKWFSACFHADRRRFHPWWANYDPTCCATQPNNLKNKKRIICFGDLQPQSPDSYISHFYSIHFCPVF